MVGEGIAVGEMSDFGNGGVGIGERVCGFKKTKGPIRKRLAIPAKIISKTKILAICKVRQIILDNQSIDCSFLACTSQTH